MDFSVDLSHTTEKNLNLEIVKLMESTHLSSISDINVTALQMLNKGPLSNFPCSMVKLLENNINLCKAAAGSLENLKTQAMATQTQN